MLHQEEQQAYNEGWNAFKNGKSNIDNPYDSEPGLQELWNEGYFDAFDESQEIDPSEDF